MININRHNYEELFLLYVDGELSAIEKRAVEAFVREHADLAAELEILQQTQLVSDEPLVFENKSSLYKTASGEINATNYETYFLNYIDEELTIEQKEKVETFVLQHPALQNAFSLLKQTKLPLETIAFPDKSTLYRKEEKETPVIHLRWWQLAAAAAVTGLAIILWTMPANKTATAPELAITQPVKQSDGPAVGAATDVKTNTPVKANSNTTQTATAPNKALIKSSIPGQAIAAIKQDIITPANKTESIAQVTDNPVVLYKEEAFAATVIPEVPKAASKTNIAATALSADIKSILPEEATDNTKTLARQVVYKELDTDDEDKVLYIGSLELNKDKLRGLLRKASSLFRGKAAREEDEKSEDSSSGNIHTLK